MIAIMIMIGIVAWMPVGLLIYTVRHLDKREGKR